MEVITVYSLEELTYILPKKKANDNISLSLEKYNFPL